MNDIQSRWVKVAEDLETRAKNKRTSFDNVIADMLSEEKDRFVSLASDSRTAELSQYQFNDPKPGEPEKELHDKLFALANALENLPDSENYTHTLIKQLEDSLLNSFAL